MSKSKTAACWTFFTRANDGRAKCTKCGESYKLSVDKNGKAASTTALNRHLESCCPNEFSKEKERKTESKKRKVDSNTFLDPALNP